MGFAHRGGPPQVGDDCADPAVTEKNWLARTCGDTGTACQPSSPLTGLRRCVELADVWTVDCTAVGEGFQNALDGVPCFDDTSVRYYHEDLFAAQDLAVDRTLNLSYYLWVDIVETKTKHGTTDV